jgi:hypothetical protein
LKKQVEENEKAMKVMQLSYEEKLAAAAKQAQSVSFFFPFFVIYFKLFF